MSILPVREVTPVSAFLMKAATLVEISFRPSATPMEIETPAPLPNAKEIEAAPATAEIVEVSLAVKVMLVAEMPPRSVPDPPSPSMEASTSWPIRFSAQTPEPLAPTPALLPAPTAAEKENTRALMVWLATAVWVSSPVA